MGQEPAGQPRLVSPPRLPAMPPRHAVCALQVVDETLPALLRLKEEGLVRHIGITGLPLKIYKYVLDRWGRSAELRGLAKSAAGRRRHSGRVGRRAPAGRGCKPRGARAGSRLWRLRGAGRPRAWHPTGYSPCHPAPARRVPPGTVDTALSYCHYSLNDRSLEE